VEISRLYTQRVPNTFLSSRGQHSNIDHFIINSKQKWQEIVQTNIITTEKEAEKMRSKDWKNEVKGCWDWKRNRGDHRAVGLSMEVIIGKNFWNENCEIKKMERKLDWKNEKHIAIYTNQLEEELKKHEILRKKKLTEVEAIECVSRIETVIKEAVVLSKKKIFGKNSKERR
jgi:hypothetical protein